MEGLVMPAKAGIQYAAASRLNHKRLWIRDHPLSRVMTAWAHFPHVPRGFTRLVGMALAGSSGQGCRG